jgi:cytochrome P450
VTNLSNPDFVVEPYAVLAGWRERAPVVFHEGLGMHLTTTHAAADAVLRDRRLGRIYRPRAASGEAAEGDPWTVFDWLHADSILDSEPPKHTRLRRLVAGAFARGHVARMRPRVEQIAATLLHDVEERLGDTGTVDVIEAYAEPLPVLVICELLGAPRTDWKQLRDWSQAIVKMYEVAPGLAAQEAAHRAAADFAAYVEALATERAADPGDDLLTSLVEARDGSDRLSPRELVATVVLLLNAGHEASVNGFGNGLHSLLAAPGELDRVLARLDDDVAVERLAEEMLRHDSPLHLFERTATTDVEVHGVTIREGQKIAALLGAANRDPAVFADPDTFRADRDPNPHLAFGAGLHFCLGAPLARMELQISIRSLLHRLGPVELASARRRPTFVLRGFEELSVACARR